MEEEGVLRRFRKGDKVVIVMPKDDIIDGLHSFVESRLGKQGKVISHREVGHILYMVCFDDNKEKAEFYANELRLLSRRWRQEI